MLKTNRDKIAMLSVQGQVRHSRYATSGKTGIDTGLVQSDGIEGCEHAHIRNDGQVIVVVTIAEGADGAHQADVEMRSAVQHGLGVFRDLVAQQLIGTAVGGVDGLHGALADAAAAAGAFVQINAHLAIVLQNGRAVGAAFRADTAADAGILVHHGLAGAVHFLLAFEGAAAHARYSG